MIGARCGRGPGARAARWIISRRTKRWTRSRLGLRGIRVWEGDAGDDGVRSAVCDCVCEFVGRGRGGVVPAEFWGADWKCCGHGRVSLDGGEFFEVCGAADAQ